MPPLKIAVATRCFQLPLKDSLRAAAASGAVGVQFDAREELRPGDLTETGIRQLLHSLSERGLSIASLVFPTRRSFYDQDELDARVAATKRAMDLAWQLKCGVVTVRAGKIPADPASKNYRILQDVLSDLAHYANRVGSTLAITPTHDSPQALLDLIESIKTGPLAIDFDPAVFVMSGSNPVDAFRSTYRQVLHLSARDAVRDIDAGGLEVALGRGEVEWIEILPLLDEIAYTGWVTVIRTQGDDRGGDVARGVKFLNNVMFS
ncbi:MAG: sugar phosphate isomerase/epimerase [Planctomycetes bacterium]|nr:sugar phosphate isomerase/epimerase [Planctomycetota bacterium]